MPRAKLLKLSEILPGINDDNCINPTKEAAQFVIEKFHQHPKWKRYYADYQGNVYHITKAFNVTKMACRGKTINDKYGYPIITVYDKEIQNSGFTMTLHKFLWECWYQQSPAPGMQIDHIDGNHLNNTKTNLRLLTAKENLGWRKNRKKVTV